MNNIKYPKGESRWFHYFTSSHVLMFLITSNPSREWYYLYEFVDGAFIRLGKAKSPIELEKRFCVDERLKS